ncbi:MAG TPA: hypothetical protein DEF00_05255 [Candidatus Taylorbacteria bacterium]|nr:MAG: hypothetical protein UY03_C0015G0018 [Parcubacteria group bacterium GW2011_GWA2_47_64]KKU97251.1 MAG: hypothetical protein UY29_C0001G0045 [Parcubacteria group bacterium GW2011_GWC2_48_17]HBV01755.1 hypothetical protein [Candidatus Taylorbacteria bacterium]
MGTNLRIPANKIGLTHFVIFCHSRAGGNPCLEITLWIPVPRLREDKLHGNDTKYDFLEANFLTS